MEHFNQLYRNKETGKLIAVLRSQPVMNQDASALLVYADNYPAVISREQFAADYEFFETLIPITIQNAVGIPVNPPPGKSVEEHREVINGLYDSILQSAINITAISCIPFEIDTNATNNKLGHTQLNDTNFIGYWVTAHVSSASLSKETNMWHIPVELGGFLCESKYRELNNIADSVTTDELFNHILPPNLKIMVPDTNGEAWQPPVAITWDIPVFIPQMFDEALHNEAASATDMNQAVLAALSGGEEQDIGELDGHQDPQLDQRHLDRSGDAEHSLDPALVDAVHGLSDETKAALKEGLPEVLGTLEGVIAKHTTDDFDLDNFNPDESQLQSIAEQQAVAVDSEEAIEASNDCEDGACKI
jgi:hypothetical protein